MFFEEKFLPEAEINLKLELEVMINEVILVETSYFTVDYFTRSKTKHKR